MKPLELKAEGSLPVLARSMRIRTYEYGSNPSELVVALIHGRSAENGTAERPLVRVHSQCLTGDTFGSTRCDCGAQLEASLEAISEESWGVLIYLPSHEGRGIGLVNKIRAYALQDRGLDTVEANVALSLPVDARHYDAAVAVLDDLGMRRLRLLTNNPSKLMALVAAGMDVFRIPMPMFVTKDNRRYLATKRDLMGHAFATPSPSCLDGDAPCVDGECVHHRTPERLSARRTASHLLEPVLHLPRANQGGS